MTRQIVLTPEETKLWYCFEKPKSDKAQQLRLFKRALANLVYYDCDTDVTIHDSNGVKVYGITIVAEEKMIVLFGYYGASTFEKKIPHKLPRWPIILKNLAAARR